MKILTHLDLNQNELRNAILQPLATAPSNPKLGQIYYNSSQKKIYSYDGTEWTVVGSNVEVSENGSITVDGQKLEVYRLPIASTEQLGGIKVGAGLTINAETGVLSATGGGTADAVDWANITSKPEFSAVATSGSYNDLTDKPTIPSKLSELTNDGNFVSDENYVHTDNNFTAEDKQKLSNVQSGAEANVQSDWQATEGDALILNKPTKLTEFTNDANFIDNTVENLVNYYKKGEVNDLIAAISTLNIEVVDALPAENISTTTIYLVPKEDKWTNNSYDEYIYVTSTSTWENIGNTVIDLSNYLQKNGDASNTTVAFTQATDVALPESGQSIAVIIGAITKYLASLQTIAFTGSYEDLTNKPTIYPHLVIEQLSLPKGQTSATTLTTFENSTISSVYAKDAITGEQIIIDWKLNSDKTITAEITSAYVNDLEINISYLSE